MHHILLQTQTDERLARLSASGHATAFTVLVERHRRSLYRVALNLVSVAEADDVLQQSLLQAWVALQRGAEIRHVRGWLHQIVRHVAIRSRATPPPCGELDEQAAAAAALRPDPDARLLMRETLANVAELPAQQRMALLRCAVQGESQAAVATELGTTETGVRQLLYRARTTLRAPATALVPLPVAQWIAGSATGAAGIATGGELARGAGLAASAKVAAAVVVIAVGSGAGVTYHRHHAGAARAAARPGSGAVAAPRANVSAASTTSAVAASSPTASRQNAPRRTALGATPRSTAPARARKAEARRADQQNAARENQAQPPEMQSAQPVMYDAASQPAPPQPTGHGSTDAGAAQHAGSPGTSAPPPPAQGGH